MCNFLVAFGLYLAGSLAPAPGVAAQAEQATMLRPVENGGAFRGKMAARGKGIFTTWGSG